MDKRILFSLLLTLVFNFSNSQNGCFEIDWEQNYGGSDRDWGDDLIITSDGGYAMTGYSRSSDVDVNSNNGDWDFWVIRLDEMGTLLWERNYGGSANDEATSIEQTTDGGFVIAGSTLSNDGDVTDNNGIEDFWIIKLDASGNLQWQQTYGGSEVDRAESVKQTADGGYVVAGFSASQNGDASENNGNFDMWLIKLDAGGNLQWEENFGGSGPDWCFEMELASDGGYILTGSTISTDGDVLENNGFYDYWIVKTDSNGAMEWSQNYGGSGEDRSYFIKEAPDGGFLISGTTYSNDGDVSSNNGGADFWVIKIDDSGNLLWEESLGGQGSEWAWAVDFTMDGGIVVTGRTNTNNGSGDVSAINGGADFWLVKLSADGVMEWENAFGGSTNEVPYAIFETEDSGFVIAGYATSSDGDVENNYGEWDYWVLKLKPRELELEIGNDTTLCTSETHLINAGIELPAAFEWQDGSTDSTILITDEGVYRVSVTVGDCVLEDSLFATYVDIETVNLGSDTSFCSSENDPFLLNASVENASSFFWLDGSTDSTFWVQQSGRYWVEVDIGGCVSIDTIDVLFNNPQVDLGPDTFKCEFETLTLNAFYPEASYLWSDGSDERKLIAIDTGTYWVTVDLNGCLESDTIHIDLCERYRDPCLEFPTAFTPNGDGINDVFMPRDFCRFETYQLSIYNRWGEELFASNSETEGWDGFYKNRKPLQGVYVYVANFEYKLDGIIYQDVIKGSFALLR